MILTPELSRKIIEISQGYLGFAYNWRRFDCVHFVRNVYQYAGLAMPTLGAHLPPPVDFHLTEVALAQMPIGHSAFFKRKASTANRVWTHVAIVYSSDEFIHCSRHFGKKVVTTTKPQFLEIYSLAAQAA